MDFASITVSMVSMGGLGALFAAGLAVANKKLYVEEDPRIAKVLECLPGANCGGCGLPGCASFAENTVMGEVALNGCPVCDDDAREAMAAILGLEAEKGEKIIARLMCQGGNYESAIKGEYLGLENCTAAQITGGGDKLCLYGCLGFGECLDACPFEAMSMSSNGLPTIDEDLCTGCGKCVEACPRNILELHSAADLVFVACKNQDSPKDARKVCIKACVGCGVCVKAAGSELMTLENHLARINYQRYGQCPELPTSKCPTEALILLESVPEDQVVVRG